MKAITFSKYGPPEALQFLEVEKPVPKPKELLIKVHCTAVNDYDWAMVRGEPKAYRLLFGLFGPKNRIPGMELSGTIEAIGDEVATFKVGDEVYGDTSVFGFGTFAEYISINEKAVIHKPKEMSFEDAASISHASMLAMQGLVDIGGLKHGLSVLINGAGGGVGFFGLQLCKLHGVEVTGVDTGDKLEMMKAHGFDHIIDYKTHDFTKSDKKYDLILDAKTNRGLRKYARVLKEHGAYVTVGGQLLRILQVVLLGWLMQLFTGKRMKLVALQPNKDLAHINQLYQGNKIKCVIDGPYPLEQAPQMIRYFGEGKHHGKVILSVSS